MEAGASSLCMRSDGGDSDKLYFYIILHRASKKVEKHKELFYRPWPAFGLFAMGKI